MAAPVVAILLLFVLLCVSGKTVIDANFDRVRGVSVYSGRSRRLHSHLPKFSKKSKGKGSGYVEDGEYDEYVWVYEEKSSKKSKSSKKEKDSKKEKYVYTTRKPTVAPFPTVSPAPTTSDNSGGKGQGDSRNSRSSSEDCPPDRPPSVIPGKNPTQKPSSVASTDVELVALETYALDYTLSNAATAPSKADFRELQTVTDEFFKEYMIDRYKVSTQAELVDFTTSFVTAHFTPGEPVHVQYNSTAAFDKDTLISLPSPSTLLTILQQSVEFPKAYTDELESKLSEGNPFSSTTFVVLTDPKPTPQKRKSNASSTSMYGIAGAGAVMVLTLAIFVGVVRRRKDRYDDDHFSETFTKKQSRSDTTVAGETFVSEINDSTCDGDSVLSSSLSFGNRNVTQIVGRESSLMVERKNTEEEKYNHRLQGISERAEGPLLPRPQRRPRTVAEIEQELLSLGYADVI